MIVSSLTFSQFTVLNHKLILSDSQTFASCSRRLVTVCKIKSDAHSKRLVLSPWFAKTAEVLLKFGLIIGKSSAIVTRLVSAYA